MPEIIAAANAVEAPIASESQVTESAPVVAKTDVSSEPEWFTKRFDELTRQRHDADRRAIAAERDRDSWRDQAQKGQQPATKVDTASKTLADFEYDEVKYRDYLQEDLKLAATTAATKAAKQALKEEQEREKASSRKQSYAKRAQEFSKANPDFTSKVSAENLPISKAMAEVIEESDEGPALAYYLANNESIAESIYEMSPLVAARAMGRIEQKLIAEREKPVKKVSEAPPPVPKIEAAGDPVVDKAIEDMTPAEFRKLRKRQIAQR